MTGEEIPYPPVGKIAVTRGGSRIEIWADESTDPDCFTGMLLLDNRTEAQIVVHDLSCMWDRAKIDHIEEPSADDLRLGWWPRNDAKAIEAQRAETQGSVHESAVAESHSPNPPHNPGTPNHE